MLFAGGSACRRLGGLAFTVVLALFAAACGDGHTTPLQPSSAVQVKVGDAAADRVIAFEMTLNALVLTASNGQPVSVLPAPRRIEFTRLAGTLEPVALLDIPQGTYTEASLTGSNVHLTYIDANGDIREYMGTTDIATHIMLNPQLGVTASSVINVDLNLGASLSLDPSNVQPPQLDPVYTFSVTPVAANQQEPEQGAMEHMVGVVTAADSGSFTMELGQNGLLLTFLVDASTAFQDATLTTLPNMIVEVDGITAAEGTLYAERVTGLTSTSGAVVEGMLTSGHMAPAGMVARTAYRPEAEVVVQDGVGNGMVNALVGAPVTVDFSQAAYGVNGEGMPDGWAFNLIGGLVFNAATIAPAQVVQVVSDTGVVPVTGGGYSMPARTVTLQEQALSGVVSDYRSGFLFDFLLRPVNTNAMSPRSALSMPVAAFDLQVPADSYLSLLTTFTTVSVGIFPETKVNGTATISDLMTVRVRGWLFYYDDEFLMVADRVDFVSAPVPTGARSSAPHQ